jgi:hypothetical protein
MTSEQTRAFARKTMLPWNLTQEWARLARLFIHGQANRIDRQEKVIADWWDATEKTGVMAEDVEELKRLLRKEEVKP